MRQIGGLTRRKFLRRAAVSLATIAAKPLLAPANDPGGWKILRQHEGNGQRVIVIGAGLAGLTAARDLVTSGFSVTVFEAQARAGGRVRTLRAPFAEGLAVEAGATRIPDNHDLTLAYCKEFNLPLVPFRVGGLRSVMYVGGTRVSAKHGQQNEWTLSLLDDEKKLDPSALREKYITPALKRLESPEDDTRWPPAGLDELDAISWEEFLSRQGASPGAITLLTLGHNRGFSPTVSALSWLRYIALGRFRNRMYRIEGGNDRLSSALVEALEGVIVFDAVVLEIDDSGSDLNVVVERAGARQVFKSDVVVAAIPFSVLRKIRIPGELTREKRQAIEQLRHVSCVKIAVQTRKQFWRDHGEDGFGLTDLPISEVWNLSPDSGEGHGVLQTYCTGGFADEFSALNEEDRVQRAKSELTALYPQLATEFEFGQSYSWGDDQWARGAWVYFLPNESLKYHEAIRRSEGRMHFAGDHTSPWPGWMQGAIHSGKRVVEEIRARRSR